MAGRSVPPTSLPPPDPAQPPFRPDHGIVHPAVPPGRGRVSREPGALGVGTDYQETPRIGDGVGAAAVGDAGRLGAGDKSESRKQKAEERSRYFRAAEIVDSGAVLEIPAAASRPRLENVGIRGGRRGIAAARRVAVE